MYINIQMIRITYKRYIKHTSYILFEHRIKYLEKDIKALKIENDKLKKDNILLENKLEKEKPKKIEYSVEKTLKHFNKCYNKIG
jgi:hypothetical protein